MTRTFHAVVPDGGDEIGGVWRPIFRCDRDIPFGRSNPRAVTTPSARGSHHSANPSRQEN